MFTKRTKNSPQAQTTTSDYPAGTFLQTEKGFFYVIGPAKRFRFISNRVLDSWSPQRVVAASEGDVAVKKLKIAAKMKFRNGSLLYSQADGKMYLVSDNKLRHITNPDWLDILGIARNDAVWVSLDETNLHEIGEPLT